MCLVELHLLEGDILVTSEQENEMNSKEDLDGPQKRGKKKHSKKGTSLWEGGVVPYVIDKNLGKYLSYLYTVFIFY